MQVDRLPDVVLAPREHAQVAHDLSRPLGPLADSLDHRIEVLQRVVHLELVPRVLHPLRFRPPQGNGTIGLEHPAQALHEVVERRDVGEDEPDRVVQLVGDTRDELTDRGHLLPLDELHLRGLQIAIRGVQLLVRGAQLLGPYPHLLLEPAGQILDGPEAVGLVHRRRDMVGHRGQQLDVAGPEPAGFARHRLDHAEHPASDREGHRDP